MVIEGVAHSYWDQFTSLKTFHSPTNRIAFFCVWCSGTRCGMIPSSTGDEHAFVFLRASNILPRITKPTIKSTAWSQKKTLHFRNRWVILAALFYPKAVLTRYNETASCNKTLRDQLFIESSTQERITYAAKAITHPFPQLQIYGSGTVIVLIIVVVSSCPTPAFPVIGWDWSFSFCFHQWFSHDNSALAEDRN